MAQESKTTFKGIFISGLFILIPLIVTLAVLVFLFNSFDNWLAPMINYLLQLTGFRLPAGWKRIPGLGIVATVLLIFLAGLFGSHYLGRRILHLAEQLITGIPVVSNIYTGVRQLVKAFSDAGTTAFKTVVMVEFPGPGQWTMGFLTAPAMPEANRLAKDKLMHVFIPAAPIPSQGLLLQVPASKMKVLPITTEDAFKMLATLGLVQKAGPGEQGQAEALPAGRSLTAGRREKNILRKRKKSGTPN